jgi:Major Facilitator Superfamily
VLSFVVSPIAGALSHRIPIRVLLGVGLVFVGVGLLLVHGVEPDSTWTALLAGFLLTGIGIGITNPGIGQAAIGVVPVEKSGMGSGINTTFRQVGISTGVAGLGAVFQSRIDSKLSALLPNADHGLGEMVASGGARAAALAAPPGEKAAYVHASTEAFISGFNEIALIAAVISFAGAALGFALVRSRDFVQPTGSDEDVAPVPTPTAEPVR